MGRHNIHSAFYNCVTPSGFWESGCMYSFYNYVTPDGGSVETKNIIFYETRHLKHLKSRTEHLQNQKLY